MPQVSKAPNPLGTAPVGTLLLQYAVPSIIATLISSLYNMVDQMFIGQRIGFLGNAATTVAARSRSSSATALPSISMCATAAKRPTKPSVSPVPG